MATNHANPGTTANPAKSSPTYPKRDARKSAQDDSTNESTNNPPNHGLPTHSTARFLWEVPKTTPISELGEKFEAWKRRQESEQTDLGRWDQ